MITINFRQKIEMTQKGELNPKMFLKHVHSHF